MHPSRLRDTGSPRIRTTPYTHNKERRMPPSRMTTGFVIIIIYSLLGLTTETVLAQPTHKPDTSFDTYKAHTLRNLEARQSILQRTQRCVSAATTKAALNTCRNHQHAAMQNLRTPNQPERKSMKREHRLRKNREGRDTDPSPQKPNRRKRELR